MYLPSHGHCVYKTKIINYAILLGFVGHSRKLSNLMGIVATSCLIAEPSEVWPVDSTCRWHPK